VIQELKSFLDEKGRLTALPAKYKKQLCAVWYMGTKVEAGRDYTQEELGDVLNAWHTFRDPATLRRALVDRGLVTRERDGSVYRRADELPTLEAFLGGNL